MVRTKARVNPWYACLGMLLMMVGCSGKQVTVSVPDESYTAGHPNEIRVADFPGMMSGSAGSSGDAATSAMSAARAARLAAVAASLSDVYFDYDRSTLNQEGRAKLEADARVLKEEQDWELLITGHCDERGSQDYNLVLGERRAQSVKRYLADLGIPESQVQIASYGKEKPFCTEQNQECWKQNRRAHFALH